MGNSPRVLPSAKPGAVHGRGDNAGLYLDQLELEAGQRSVCHPLGQFDTAPECCQIAGQCVQLQPDLVVVEPLELGLRRTSHCPRQPMRAPLAQDVVGRQGSVASFSSFRARYNYCNGSASALTGRFDETIISFKGVHGFVAQIVLRSCFPFPRMDLAYGHGRGYAKSCEVV